MYFELLSSQSSASNYDQIGAPSDSVGFMEGGRTRRNHSARILNADNMRTLQLELDSRSYPSAYFSLESFLLLLLLFAASLLILPLILPPLPPPPSLLLLLPIGLLGVLLFLAFMPSDIRKITTSYL